MTTAAEPSTPYLRTRPNGWWGMAIFAAAEATLVGAIVGSYFYLAANSRSWPPLGTPLPRITAPVLLAAVLLAALIPVRAALVLARLGRRGATVSALALATSLQAGYLAFQLHLFESDLAKFTPQSSAYASIYYVLVGAALAHVAVGVLIDLWLLVRLAPRLTPYRLGALEAATLYWYVVAAIALVVLVTEVSPRL